MTWTPAPRAPPSIRPRSSGRGRERTSASRSPQPRSPPLATALSAAVETDASASSPGTVHWQFSLPYALTAFLGANDALAVPYQVTVKDGAGNASTQTVTVLLTGANDAPVVSGPVTDGVVKGELASTLNALANASDVDAASQLAVVDVPA